jgi:acyl-CoA synthetase (AMP-forming)/AMP-acid ligase II
VATRLPDDVAPPFDERLSPLPGTEVRVVDAGGRVLDSGEAGEICVRGATLMRGYLGRPEATARALRQGWLQTGDLGVLDDRGRLRVLDRRDDLIVSGGENVYPAEIEAVLNGHPAVREAAVVGEPDAEYGARPMAWWVPLVPGSPAPDLEAYCRGRLAGFKVPRRFVPIAELPRNVSGKLLRRELRALAGADTGD